MGGQSVPIASDRSVANHAIYRCWDHHRARYLPDSIDVTKLPPKACWRAPEMVHSHVQGSILPVAARAMAAQPAPKPEISGPSKWSDITIGRVMREKVRL